MATTSRKTGFTLTELTVAIAFFSILLLTIATVTINMTKNYHKGLSLKSINTIGLGLIDEFSSAVSESPVFDAESLCKTLGNIGDKTTVLDENGDPTRDGAGNIIYEYINGENGADRCMNDHAKEFIHQQFEEEITVEKNTVQNDKDLPTGGVFCTGKYSYVWNTGYVISQDETNHSMTSYFYSGGTRLGDGFRLRKFYDTGRSFCISNFYLDNLPHIFWISFNIY